MPDKPLALSVKIGVLDDEGRYLILKRPVDCNWNPGRWDLPGGKLEPGETFDDALRREVLEETGLDVAIQKLSTAVEDETETYNVIHLILTGKKTAGEVRLSPEHDDFAWVAPEDLGSYQLCNYLQGRLNKKATQ